MLYMLLLTWCGLPICFLSYNIGAALRWPPPLCFYNFILVPKVLERYVQHALIGVVGKGPLLAIYKIKHCQLSVKKKKKMYIARLTSWFIERHHRLPLHNLHSWSPGTLWTSGTYNRSKVRSLIGPLQIWNGLYTKM